MHDDYGEEPSWPVAVLIGVLAFVVGVIVRIRECVGGVFDRAGGDDDEPSQFSSE
jgi:hypothetical protein